MLVYLGLEGILACVCRAIQIVELALERRLGLLRLQYREIIITGLHVRMQPMCAAEVNVYIFDFCMEEH